MILDRRPPVPATLGPTGPFAASGLTRVVPTTFFDSFSAPKTPQQLGVFENEIGA
jgi:hypothetical protein